MEFLPLDIPDRTDLGGFTSLLFVEKTWFLLNVWQSKTLLLRKEVIQPHLPIRLPCYDFTPITYSTLDGCLLAVDPPASGVVRFRGVTGGVYKARERIHLGMLTRDY
jgi:hypothetical protein